MSSKTINFYKLVKKEGTTNSFKTFYSKKILKYLKFYKTLTKLVFYTFNKFFLMIITFVINLLELEPAEVV